VLKDTFGALTIVQFEEYKSLSPLSSLVVTHGKNLDDTNAKTTSI